MELRPYEEKTVRKRSTGYFWWSALLLLLAGACFFSWVASFYVVGHPEDPRCYRLLKKLKRIEPAKRFKVTEAPRGDFYSPARLLDRFGRMGPAELARRNSELLRAYIMNYRETKDPVIYVTGKYDVVEAYPMGPMDLFPSGVALVAQSIEHPQLVLESLFTSTRQTVQAIREALPVGSDLSLRRSQDLFALLHVERFEDGRMQFTAVPLSYGTWKVKNGQGEFSLKAPEELEKLDPKFAFNIDAGLPVIRGERLAKGLEAYATFRRKALAGAGDDQAALAKPELVRFEPPKSAAPPARPPVETPAPQTPPALIGAPRFGPAVAATPRPIPTPAPAQPLPPRPIVRAVPGATTVAPNPAITPGATTTEPAVAVAPAASVPPVQDRRVLTAGQASAMVEQFGADVPTLLAGDFIVTAVSGQRIALRTRESLRDPAADPKKPGSNAALIVVDFPPGKQPPTKNSSLTRNGENGFEIRDVIRTEDGQITIVAAERG